MLSVLLTAVLTVSPQKDEVQKGPDPAAVEQAVNQLQEAFDKKGGAEARKRAIADAQSVVAPEVIAMVAKGLADRDPSVKLAAIDALGWMYHDDSVRALESWYKKNKKKLLNEPELLAPTFKALGRLASPSSVAILSEKPNKAATYPVIQARVMALGNIRTKESVEAIISMTARVGTRDLEKWMGKLRLAMFHIVGEDHGPDPKMWGDWWRQVRKDLRIPEETPAFDEARQKAWDAYWGYDEKHPPRVR